MNLTWSDLWNFSLQLAQTWTSAKVTRVVIPKLPTRAGLTALCAALSKGYDVILDEKQSYQPASTDLLVDQPGLGDSIALSLHGPVPEELRSALAGRTISFVTSGSTAEPKVIQKSMEGLQAEVTQLKFLYEISSGDSIATLVRPFHIYGFLHSFLLPIAANARVTYWNTAQGLPTKDDGFPINPKLLILVPAHLSLINPILEFTNLNTLISSGAAIGPERLHTLQKSKPRFQSCYEILGSTETGGMGYRRADLDEDFTLFEGVTLESTEEGTVVHSPFLTPEKSVTTADVFETTASNTFRHMGRSDRVFKYAGLRYSLAEIENRISRLNNNAAVVCNFKTNPNLPQGGQLIAYIESQPKNFRSEYHSQGSQPYPHKLHFLSIFPRDAQGKISIKNLEDLTTGHQSHP